MTYLTDEQQTSNELAMEVASLRAQLAAAQQANKDFFVAQKVVDTALRTEIDRLNRELDTARAQYRADGEELNEYAKGVETLEAECEALRAQLAERDGRILELEANMKTRAFNEKQWREVNDQLAAEKVRADAASLRAHDLSAEVGTLKLKNMRLEKECDAAIARADNNAAKKLEAVRLLHLALKACDAAQVDAQSLRELLPKLRRGLAAIEADRDNRWKSQKARELLARIDAALAEKGTP